MHSFILSCFATLSYHWGLLLLLFLYYKPLTKSRNIHVFNIQRTLIILTYIWVIANRIKVRVYYNFTLFIVS